MDETCTKCPILPAAVTQGSEFLHDTNAIVIIISFEILAFAMLIAWIGGIVALECTASCADSVQ